MTMTAVPFARARRSSLEPWSAAWARPVVARAQREPFGSTLSVVNRRRERQKGDLMSLTPVCELLRIERPIAQAPVAADPRLPAAVSDAGALGSVALWWADDAGALVREVAALTDGPFTGNFVLTSDQHRRLDQALSAGLRIVSFLLGNPAEIVAERVSRL
jgi:hypothetical protein